MMLVAMIFILTAMFAAGVPLAVLMLVMAALDIGIEFQVTGNQGFYRLISIAKDAAV